MDPDSEQRTDKISAHLPVHQYLYQYLNVCNATLAAVLRIRIQDPVAFCLQLTKNL